jgi:hypothetical protein
MIHHHWHDVIMIRLGVRVIMIIMIMPAPAVTHFKLALTRIVTGPRRPPKLVHNTMILRSLLLGGNRGCLSVQATQQRANAVPPRAQLGCQILPLCRAKLSLDGPGHRDAFRQLVEFCLEQTLRDSADNPRFDIGSADLQHKAKGLHNL